ETEFEIIQPKKNRKGNRQFTKEDIENVRLIYHLVKEKGFTLQGAKEMIKNDSLAMKDKMDLIASNGLANNLGAMAALVCGAVPMWVQPNGRLPLKIHPGLSL
ncbi:MAG: MerR family transcriptional regulator, partial [Gemmataceae bacterium]